MANAKNDLTKGNMSRNLVVFAIPFLLANLLQSLYNTADLLIVGTFGGGAPAMAGVANGGEVMHLMMSLVMGFTTGATILIGQFFGAKDKENTDGSVGMSLTFSIIMGVLLTLVFALFSHDIVRLLGTPKAAEEATFDYLSICGWGIIFIVGYNALSAIFRAFGNSKAPLVFVGIACTFNIAADLVLVAWCKMGVKGAAYATIISQFVSSLLAFLYLKYGGFGVNLAPRNWRLQPKLVWRYICLGTPLALQSILVSLSFLFIVYIVNQMDATAAAAAGYGIVSRVNGFAMLPAISFSMAISAITAQNIGANRLLRAIATLRLALIYTMAFGIISLLGFQLIPEKIVSIFVSKSSLGYEDVVKSGALFARGFSWDYILVPIIFCSNGFLNGCGRTLFTTCNNLGSTFLVRIPAAYVFGILMSGTLREVGYSAPLASVASAIVSITFLASGKWRPQGLNDRHAVLKKEVENSK